ncbi:hypothetical protein CSKR_109767, partial [Clonorchis sinensis]
VIECAALGRLMFQLLRYSRYRDTCIGCSSRNASVLDIVVALTHNTVVGSQKHTGWQIQQILQGISINTLICRSIWFCERLIWNPAESPVCDVSRRLNVLHQAASCFSCYDIRDIAIHNCCRRFAAFDLVAIEIPRRICPTQSTNKQSSQDGDLALEGAYTNSDLVGNMMIHFPGNWLEESVMGYYHVLVCPNTWVISLAPRENPLDMQMGVFVVISPIWVQVEHKVDGNAGTTST